MLPEEKRGFALKLDHDLPDINAEISGLLRRCYFDYTHLHGPTKPTALDFELFQLFAEDCGMFRSLSSGDVFRVFREV